MINKLILVNWYIFPWGNIDIGFIYVNVLGNLDIQVGIYVWSAILVIFVGRGWFW